MSNNDKCPVSQIDGNGTPRPCVYLQGHSGEHKYESSVKEDKAINPDYYHGTTVDDFIEEFKLGFRLGSVIKYIARHEHKDKIKDLKKAQWYLRREIEKLEAGK